MKKQKAFKWIAGLLSAAVLFTSEGMSCLAFAAPDENLILSPLTIDAAASGEERSPEDEVTLSENSEDSTENPADDAGVPGDETEKEPGNPNEEIPDEKETNSENNLLPSNGQNDDGDETKDPEEQPEEVPVIDTVSDNSLSSNNLMSLEEETPAMTDFAIVDEGGNLLDETRILYIEETSYRQLHVKLTPENAVADTIIWSSDNARILVTDGKVSLKPSETETVESNVVTGIVSARIGELIKTCKVEFQPLMKDIIIVNQNGVAIPESGITILPGQQKKLGIKIQPEGAVVEGQRTRFTLGDTSCLRIDAAKGILTVRQAPKTFPYETTLTATITNPHTNQKVSAACKVTVPAPGEQDGIRCGDILFYCDGMQPDYKKIDDKNWEVSANRNSKMTLTFLGEQQPDTEYAIFYNDSGRGIDTSRPQRPGTKYSNSLTLRNDKYPLQFVLGTKPTNQGYVREYTLSEVYTINFKMTNYRSYFRLSSNVIQTIPGAPDQEIQVRMLPDTCEMKDVTWVSGDERLVKIKERTEKGVIVQFGQSVGTTQITAIAKDYRGQECYASCEVRLSMKLPSPSFESESGGETSEETAGGDTNFYWLIDKGGNVSITIRGASKASIYYTTNGQNPATNGILYQSPITVNENTTIKAYARLEGYVDSSVYESEFRIGNPKFSISPSSVTIPQGKEAKVSFALPTGADPSTITWDSSDTEIAQGITNSDTDADGNTTSVSHKIFTGISAGKCTVTATITDYAGREQTAACQVSVPGQLEITPAVTLEEEDTAAIKITKLPAGYTKDDVSWMVDYSITDASLITFGTDDSGNKTITASRLENTQEVRTVTVRASLSTDGDDICARCQVTIVPRQYKVNFFGYNKKLIKTENVYRNQSATPPSDEMMSKAAPKGYRFDGWEVPDSWKNIVENKDIYAKEYVQIIYTINYQLGSEGTNSAENPTSYKVTDKTIDLREAIPAPERKFAGWYLDENYSGSPIEEIPTGSTGHITLYAKWISAITGLHIDPIADQPYTGKAILPEIKVYDGEKLLSAGIDYTIKYKNNTKANMQPEADSGKAPTVMVTGKGNYESADIETFRIVPQSIAADAAEVVIPDLYLAYTGKMLTITPTVLWNGKKLKHKTDFEVLKISQNNVDVIDCVNEGIYNVTISGKGNFSGERVISLTVTTKTLLSKVSFKPNKLKDIFWADLQGKTLGEANIEVDKGVVLKKGATELQKGSDADYTVTFDTNAKEVGTYEAIFTGTGTNYVGTVTKTFKITGKPLTAGKLKIEGLDQLVYNGAEQMPSLSISYKDGNNLIPMTSGTDYTLTYQNTKNAGNKASVTITGLNGYHGTVKKTFKIAPYSLKDDATATASLITTSLMNKSVPYEKGGAKPKITVKYGEMILTEGKDYTVSYKNNNKIALAEDGTKAPSYTVKGKGNFKDALTPQTFSIVPQNIGKLPITAEDVMAAAPNTNKGETVGITGKGKYKSTPKITDFNGKALSAGTDFLKTYTFTDENGVVLGPKDQIPEGSILTVTVQGTNNYTGETQVSYRVLAAKMSLKSANISLKKGVVKTYDLEPVVLKKEDLVVKLNGRELSKDDYTIVSYTNNRKKGTAKVTIQGVGAYGGRKTVNFTIKARKLSWFKTP